MVHVDLYRPLSSGPTPRKDLPTVDPKWDNLKVSSSRQPPTQATMSSESLQKQTLKDLSRLMSGNIFFSSAEKADFMVSFLAKRGQLPRDFGERLHAVVQDPAKRAELREILHHKGNEGSGIPERLVTRTVLLVDYLEGGVDNARGTKSSLQTKSLGEKINLLKDKLDVLTSTTTATFESTSPTPSTERSSSRSSGSIEGDVVQSGKGDGTVPINRQSTSISHDRGSSIVHEEGTSIVHGQGTAIVHEEGTSIVHDQGTAIVHEEGTSIVHDQGTSIVHEEGTSIVHDQGTSIVHEEGTSVVHEEGTSVVHEEGTSIVNSGTMVHSDGTSIVKGDDAPVKKQPKIQGFDFKNYKPIEVEFLQKEENPTEALFSPINIPGTVDPSIKSSIVEKLEPGLLTADNAGYARKLSPETMKVMTDHLAKYPSIDKDPNTNLSCQTVSVLAYIVARENGLTESDALAFGNRIIDRIGSGELKLPEALGNLSSTLKVDVCLHHFDLPKDTRLVKVESELKKLGQGEMNTVYLAKADLGKGVQEVVVKPIKITDELGGVSERALFLPKLPKHAMRNIATFDVDKRLGFGVICESRLGTYNDVSTGKQTLGLTMEKAPGKGSDEIPRELFNDPEVRKGMTKVQLLDAILGQGDRHGGNILVHKDSQTGKVTVTGIDSDQCLGRQPTDPDHLVQQSFLGNPLDRGMRGCRMPRVVDEDMVRSLDDLSSKDLREILGNFGEKEVEAAVKRLETLKSHVHSDKCRIIQPNDWGSVTISMNENTFGKEGQVDAVNSYFARGRFFAEYRG